MSRDRLQPAEFLEHFHDIADPPFCFSCGIRRARCRCVAGPLSKEEFLELIHRPTKPALQDFLGEP